MGKSTAMREVVSSPTLRATGRTDAGMARRTAPGAATFLTWQQTLGNHAVQRLLAPSLGQPAPAIAPIDDALEREAAQVARAVVAGETVPIRRGRAPGGRGAAALVQRQYLDRPGQWAAAVGAWSARVAGLRELLNGYETLDRDARLQFLAELPGRIDALEDVLADLPPDALSHEAFAAAGARLAELRDEIPRERQRLSEPLPTTVTGEPDPLAAPLPAQSGLGPAAAGTERPTVGPRTPFGAIKVDERTQQALLPPEDRAAQARFAPIAGEQAIFPGGRDPRPEDIHQTNLGDCYLQAVLISIAKADPAHFKAMMQDGPDSVTVTFYHVTDAEGEAFKPVPIIVDKSLPVSADGQRLYNAGALWVGLLQKAFAIFAQRFGQYGAAYERPVGGYRGIEIGESYRLYGVFYGPARRGRGYEGMRYSSGEANLIAENLPFIKLLQQAAGGDPALRAANEAMNLAVGSHLSDLLQRTRSAALDARSVLTAAQDQAWLDELSHQLDAAIDEEQHAEGKPLSSKPAVQAVVDTAARLAGTADRLGALRADPVKGPKLAPLHDFLLDLKTAGGAPARGPRMIFIEHAYAVLDATLVKTDGAPLTTPAGASLDEEALMVDPDRSAVRLRNPHHRRSPNPAGNAERERGDTGEFTLTLREFFRNFSRVQWGWVQKTGQPR